MRTGCSYLNSDAISTETGIPNLFFKRAFPTIPAYMAVPHATTVMSLISSKNESGILSSSKQGSESFILGVMVLVIAVGCS